MSPGHSSQVRPTELGFGEFGRFEAVKVDTLWIHIACEVR